MKRLQNLLLPSSFLPQLLTLLYLSLFHIYVLFQLGVETSQQQELHRIDYNIVLALLSVAATARIDPSYVVSGNLTLTRAEKVWWFTTVRLE